MVPFNTTEVLSMAVFTFFAEREEHFTCVVVSMDDEHNGKFPRKRTFAPELVRALAPLIRGKATSNYYQLIAN